MNGIKALEKLRRLAKEVVDMRWGVEFDRAVDAVEAEVAERFMELPVDEDGVPIRVGDTVEFGENRNQGIVKALNERMVITMHVDDDCMNYAKYGLLWDAGACHHAKPRTLEDVLDELFGVANLADDYEQRTRAEIVGRYADELRELMGGAE